MLDIKAKPVTRFLCRWNHALPQYNLGYQKKVETILDSVKRIPGLFLAGNFLSGASIGACASQAEQTSKEVVQYLESLTQAGKSLLMS